MGDILQIKDLSKNFTMHTQNGAEINVFRDVWFDLKKGESVGITGPSGMGKSSLLKIIYGSYKADTGQVLIKHQGRWFDVADCLPRQILSIREATIGYVSQFLRVIPRVPTIAIVAEPLLERGVEKHQAYAKAGELLIRLNIPETLWSLSPLTFSGGEQQRVNIARGFIAPSPIMLVDEPTASLDDANRDTVLAMINEVRQQGTAVLGVFHNSYDRNMACTREFNLSDFRKAA